MSSRKRIRTYSPTTVVEGGGGDPGGGAGGTIQWGPHFGDLILPTVGVASSLGEPEIISEVRSRLQSSLSEVDVDGMNARLGSSALVDLFDVEFEARPGVNYDFYLAESEFESALLGSKAGLAEVSPDYPAQAGSSLSLRRFDRAYDAGAHSAVQVPLSGRSDWTDVPNAVGYPDGASASISGNVLGARAGSVEMTFNPVIDTSLTITSVAIRCHVTQSGTFLNNGNLTIWHRYGNDTTWRQLAVFTGNTSGILNYDITANIGQDWGKLAGLVVAVDANFASGATPTATIDGVRMVVNAEAVF